MQVVRAYRLNNLSPTRFRRLKQAQMEAAHVWNECMETHKEARLDHLNWPNERTLRQAVKGSFALHSQSIQAVVRTFVTTIATTRKLREEYPEMRMKYPWRVIRFYPVKWPAQAVHQEEGRVVLPMGKGHPSLILPLTLPEGAGACTLVWNRGFELHVCVEVPLPHESTQARISCSTGSERGTSSRCPRCKHKHKPKGRNWACRRCGFRGHRDLVGSVNMHQDAFGIHVKFPRSFTYLRPGKVRSRSRRADTPQRCLDQPVGQPHLAEMVSPE